ncbi:MAG TPA: universal stress protein [Steroidobacteraceae bacterium]|nr:universal stress protein [Steroidobacteraceae bacterium]
MRAVRRILVAVKDPESRSLPAVAKAAQLARAFGARLELFHGITTPLYADAFAYSGRSITEVERGTRARLLSQLQAVAARLQRHGIEVDVSADWDFPAYEAVVRRATRIKADLIVAGRHAGRRLAPWLLHLADWELLRLSPVPVLLVKSPRAYRRPVVLAALDPSHAFSKPASLDQEILRAGRMVTEALHGTLHAMHACVPMPAGGVPAEAMTARIAGRIEAEALARATTAFERSLRQMKLPAARRHLILRNPVDAIQRTAREVGSAIVVMGAVSRSGLKRVFIGNTAERVLDQLTCDVLVVKPARFVSRVSRARRGVRFVTSALPMP